MDPDLEELAAIIELLETAEFTEFRFEKGDLKIAVSRGGMLSDTAPSPAVPVAAAAPSPASSAVQPPAAPSAPADRAPAPGGVHVTSPMLGSFYRSPKPGEAPFVEVGAIVAVGDSLCIIEVMKLMSSVVSDVAGEVTAILARDGELVEFEQPLFEIRPLP
jgi:acetyl-CoA carboxylase biotin carboxyl carrier protein